MTHWHQILTLLLTWFWRVDHWTNLLSVIVFGLYFGYVHIEKYVATPATTIFWLCFSASMSVEFIQTVIWSVRGFAVPASFYFILWLPIWFFFSASLALGIHLRSRKRARTVQRLIPPAEPAPGDDAIDWQFP